MAADRIDATCAARASPRVTVRAVSRVAVVVALSWSTAAAATAPNASPPSVAGKPTRSVIAKNGPALLWHDAGVPRRLSLASPIEADFSPSAGGTGSVLRPAGSSANGAFVSPVLRDESGQIRALPGGVLVVLATPLGEPAARTLIARSGAVPARRLSDTLWLVEGPVGLGSLELANRLHDSGLFAAAQPNWWIPRTLK